MAVILVLMGGDAPEREVSLRSGRAVAMGLQRGGHQVITADLSYRYEGNLPPSPLPAADNDEPLRFSPKELPHWLQTLRPEVVFPVLHGGYGEDGTLQAMLELLCVPYAFSPPTACFLAMNKAHFKRLLLAEGIPTPKHVLVARRLFEQDPQGMMDTVEEGIGYPCVVKPSSQGSTIGASVVDEPDRGALQAALREAFRYDDEAIVEQKIVGKEITVAVLGREEKARALPAIEIIPKTRFFDYATKYTPGMADHRIPPSLPEEVVQDAQTIAVRVHRLLGCRGVTRTDMMVSGEGKVFVLELNAIPGMTEVSLVPEAAKAAGISFEALVQILLEDALEGRGREGR
jgi:D-alanine-D-alanine ligase